MDAGEVDKIYIYPNPPSAWWLWGVPWSANDRHTQCERCGPDASPYPYAAANLALIVLEYGNSAVGDLEEVFAAGNAHRIVDQ